eukprot:gene3840-biopygen1497
MFPSEIELESKLPIPLSARSTALIPPPCPHTSVSSKIFMNGDRQTMNGDHPTMNGDRQTMNGDRQTILYPNGT